MSSSGPGASDRAQLADRFFRAVTLRPRLVIASAALLVGAAATALPGLTRDSRIDAFIAAEEPVMQLRERVRAVFGLRDPIVLLVVRDRPEGVFAASALALVEELTQRLRALPHVDPDRVTSLATLETVTTIGDALEVRPFLGPQRKERLAAGRLRELALSKRAWVGSVVSADGRATTISAELNDEAEAQEVYDAVLRMAREVSLGDAELHVAGFGAFTATLGRYIEKDMNRLIVLVALTVALVCFVAFRTVRGTLLPQVMVASTLVLTAACMVLSGATVNLVSNALLPLLMALGVANSIHFTSQYYEEAARDPSATSRTLAVRSAVKLWRPCMATSFTDVAGFLDIYVTTSMPPMKSFALLGAFGAIVPFVLSFTLLPCLLTILPARRCPMFSDLAGSGRQVTSRGGRAGLWVLSHARIAFSLFVGLAILGVIGAKRTVLDDSRVGYYRDDELVAHADMMLGRYHIGSDTLDLLVEGDGPDSLLEPHALEGIAELQRYLATRPEVTASVSIADVLADVGRATGGGKEESGLPTSADLAAQYVLLIEDASLGALLDPEHERANIRAFLDAREYRQKREFFRPLERYLDVFSSRYPELTVRLAGTAPMDYLWVKSVGRFYLFSTLLSLGVVWLMVLVTFRSSMSASVLVMMPIVAGIFFVSALMGFGGIHLGIATSLFASIAIGVGVDFAIHTVDKLTVLCREQGHSLDRAMVEMIDTTGRALTFSSSTTLLGFSVIMTSVIPTLAEFGLILTVAVAASIAASLIVIPATVKLFRPQSVCGVSPI